MSVVCGPSDGGEVCLQAGDLLAQFVLLLAGLLQALAGGALPQVDLHVPLGPCLQLLHNTILAMQRRL